MVCKTCGNQLSDTAKFCPKCGTKIVIEQDQNKFCSVCGNKLNASAKFCPKCGTTCQPEITPAASAAAPQATVVTPVTTVIKTEKPAAEPEIPVITPAAAVFTPAHERESVDGGMQTSPRNMSAEMPERVHRAVFGDSGEVNREPSPQPQKHIEDAPRKSVRRPEHTEQKPVKKPGKHVSPLAIIIPIVVVLLGAAAAAYFLVLKPQTIRLSDYTELSIEGCDGYAELTVNIDKDRLAEDIINGTKNYAKFRSLLKPGSIEDAVEAFDPTELVQFNKTTGLGNGDVVTAEINPDNEHYRELFNVNFVNEKIESQIDGLDEVGSYDPFESVSVTFTGTSPAGQAVIDYGNDERNKELNWMVDKTTGLANGDTIKIYFVLPDKDKFIDKYGVLPSGTEKEYMVKGLEEEEETATEISALTRGGAAFGTAVGRSAGAGSASDDISHAAQESRQAESDSGKRGWIKEGGKWYYYDNNGQKATGWIEDSGKTFYMDQNGNLTVGWKKINGYEYYFGKEGDLKTKWIKDGGNWYYTDSKGRKQYGWIKDNGKEYYLDSTGKLLTNTTTPDGFRVDGEGRKITESTAETRPAETQPAETRPAETQPAETTQAETTRAASEEKGISGTFRYYGYVEDEDDEGAEDYNRSATLTMKSNGSYSLKVDNGVEKHSYSGKYNYNPEGEGAISFDGTGLGNSGVYEGDFIEVYVEGIGTVMLDR